MGYVIIQEAPEIMERASKMFVRLDCGGSLMLLGRGLIRGVRLGGLRRWCVWCGSRATAHVE